MLLRLITVSSWGVPFNIYLDGKIMRHSSKGEELSGELKPTFATKAEVPMGNKKGLLEIWECLELGDPENGLGPPFDVR